jgi:SSS family solute:Na+ symporter
VLQTPVLLIGSITIVIVGLIKVGGWGEMQAIFEQSKNLTAHGDSMLGLMRSPQDPEFPWTGVILGSAIIGFWYWNTDQFIVQRVLSGRNETQSRRGAIFGAYLKLLPVFIFLVPGLIAFALNEKGLIELTDSDAAFPTLVNQLLPIGLKGIVVGGLLAALMSSLAALFNSSAALFTVDFYKKFKPNASEKNLVFVGRIATIVIVALGIAWIPVMKGIGKVLYEYLQDVQSLLAPGIASVFLLGVFWKRATPAAGLAGLATGFVLGMIRLVFNVFADKVSDGTWYHAIWVAPNWLHYEIALFVIIIVLMMIVSTFTAAKDPASIEGLYFGSASAEQRALTRASWNKWDVINSAIIIAFIIGFYIYFW